jgi:cell division protein FtsI (penicillin-binding protein 3)
MMIAFEDGLVKSVNDCVDTSPFQRTTDPHAPTIKNMKQVIAWSSNTGIARVIFRGYRDNPGKFYSRWKSIGLLEPMHSGIGGETTGRVDSIHDQNRWGGRETAASQQLNLARQAYGYNVEIPPLYTLAYYNAIANGGKMVRPHLVRSLIDENGKDSVVNAGYIREHVCSPETAEKLRQCLYEVVWGKGTGNAVQDDRVAIAGKTGTVLPYDYKRLHNYDSSKRRYAFAGFFPYDNPKYSCMVVIQAPAHSTSAARSSGAVLKNVAVKLFARGLLNDGGSSYTHEKTPSTPVLYASTSGSTATLTKGLGVKVAKQIKASKAQTSKGRVPDVTGLDAPSAVRALEKAGFNVRIIGRGYVVSQSLAPGGHYPPGTPVTIGLRL